jgi:Protein of unknown function (DUF2510)
MSAPAGWHLQPDGQERYWDGTRWTDQFRSPLPSDPTAPPPAPEWAATVDETQALDVDSTQAIPAPVSPEPQYPSYQQPTYPQPDQAQPGYQQPTYQAQPPYQQPYQQPGYPQAGYGAPGSQTYAPPRQGSGLAKGCLIAAVVGLLVVGAVIAAIFVFASRAVDSVSQSFPSGFPTSLPTDLPTDGTGETLTVQVGDGFDLPRATVRPGWRLEAQAGGIPAVNVTGMKAEVSSDNGVPVIFSMSVTGSDGASVETLCTAASGQSRGAVDVTCIPLFGDVAEATEVTVTSGL